MDGCTPPDCIRTVLAHRQCCYVVLERPLDPLLSYFSPWALPFVVSDGEEGVVYTSERCARAI